jgi:hypothetical protein
VLATNEEIAVWVEDGVPRRLVHRGRRFEVSDTPTRLAEPDIPFITHPPAMPRAWRFQGTDSSGVALIFDVRHDVATDRWILIHVYN